MANSTGICDVFKVGCLRGNVNLGTATINAALYLASATTNNTTATYTGTGEVTGGSYSVKAVTTQLPLLAGNIAYWTPVSIAQWTSVTMTAFDAVLLYYTNSLIANAVAVFNFGSTSVSSGNFTINMPSNTATTALIRLT